MSCKLYMPFVYSCIPCLYRLYATCFTWINAYKKLQVSQKHCVFIRFFVFLGMDVQKHCVFIWFFVFFGFWRFCKTVLSPADHPSRTRFAKPPKTKKNQKNQWKHNVSEHPYPKKPKNQMKTRCFRKEIHFAEDIQQILWKDKFC